MKTIKNNIIPIKGFTAMTIWPFVFVRKDEAEYYTEVDERHEAIHGEQQKEMLAAGVEIAIALAVFGCGWWSLLAVPLFYWVYLIEFLLKWWRYRNVITAHKNISAEREAFNHQDDVTYLDRRTPYVWFLSL